MVCFVNTYPLDSDLSSGSSIIQPSNNRGLTIRRPLLLLNGYRLFPQDDFRKDYTTGHVEKPLTLFGVLFNGVTGIMGMHCLHTLRWPNTVFACALADAIQRTH